MPNTYTKKTSGSKKAIWAEIDLQKAITLVEFSPIIYNLRVLGFNFSEIMNLKHNIN